MSIYCDVAHLSFSQSSKHIMICIAVTHTKRTFPRSEAPPMWLSYAGRAGVKHELLRKKLSTCTCNDKGRENTTSHAASDIPSNPGPKD